MFSQDSLDDIDTSSIPEFHIFVLSILQFHWIGLRENLQETPISKGNSYDYLQENPHI
jgi:hypothetical protein